MTTQKQIIHLNVYILALQNSEWLRLSEKLVCILTKILLSGFWFCIKEQFTHIATLSELLI